MSLIAPADQEKLRDAFNEMTRQVRLLFFTQALGCETCLQTRQILDELPALSDKIAIDEVNFVLEPDRAAPYGIDRVPAIAVTYEEAGGESHRGTGAPGVINDTRIRFLGAPSGYEFMSLVRAVLLAGGGQSMLSPEGRARLASVDTPVTMHVFTTPT